MVQFLPMSPAVRDEVLRYFPKTDDPEVRERRRHIARVLLEEDPKVGRPLVEKGLAQGREEGLELAYERRLGRALRDAERATVRERVGQLFFGIWRPFPATTEGAPDATPGPTRASRADARRRPAEPRLDGLCAPG